MKKLLVLVLILSFSLKIFAYENLDVDEYNVMLTTSCDDLKGFKANVRNLHFKINGAHDSFEYAFDTYTFKDTEKIIPLSIFANMIINLANREYLLKQLFNCPKYEKKFSVGFASLENQTSKNLGWKPQKCNKGKSCFVDLEENTLSQIKKIEKYFNNKKQGIKSLPEFTNIKDKLEKVVFDIESNLILQDTEIKKELQKSKLLAFILDRDNIVNEEVQVAQNTNQTTSKKKNGVRHCINMMKKQRTIKMDTCPKDFNDVTKAMYDSNIRNLDYTWFNEEGEVVKIGTKKLEPKKTTPSTKKQDTTSITKITEAQKTNSNTFAQEVKVLMAYNLKVSPSSESETTNISANVGDVFEILDRPKPGWALVKGPKGEGYILTNFIKPNIKTKEEKIQVTLNTKEVINISQINIDKNRNPFNHSCIKLQIFERGELSDDRLRYYKEMYYREGGEVTNSDDVIEFNCFCMRPSDNGAYFLMYYQEKNIPNTFCSKKYNNKPINFKKYLDITKNEEEYVGYPLISSFNEKYITEKNIVNLETKTTTPKKKTEQVVVTITNLDKKSLKEELRYWKDLFDDELISKEEYDAKRKALLEGGVATTQTIKTTKTTTPKPKVVKKAKVDKSYKNKDYIYPKINKWYNPWSTSKIINRCMSDYNKILESIECTKDNIRATSRYKKGGRGYMDLYNLHLNAIENVESGMLNSQISESEGKTYILTLNSETISALEIREAQDEAKRAANKQRGDALKKLGQEMMKPGFDWTTGTSSSTNQNNNNSFQNLNKKPCMYNFSTNDYQQCLHLGADQRTCFHFGISCTP